RGQVVHLDLTAIVSIREHLSHRRIVLVHLNYIEELFLDVTVVLQTSLKPQTHARYAIFSFEPHMREVSRNRRVRLRTVVKFSEFKLRFEPQLDRSRRGIGAD